MLEIHCSIMATFKYLNTNTTISNALFQFKATTLYFFFNIKSNYNFILLKCMTISNSLFPLRKYDIIKYSELTK